jgi:hypothetical protein
VNIVIATIKLIEREVVSRIEVDEDTIKVEIKLETDL